MLVQDLKLSQQFCLSPTHDESEWFTVIQEAKIPTPIWGHQPEKDVRFVEATQGTQSYLFPHGRRVYVPTPFSKIELRQKFYYLNPNCPCLRIPDFMDKGEKFTHVSSYGDIISLNYFAESEVVFL